MGRRGKRRDEEGPAVDQDGSQMATDESANAAEAPSAAEAPEGAQEVKEEGPAEASNDADLGGEETHEEENQMSEFEALLRAQADARSEAEGNAPIRAIPNPKLALKQVTIAGRTFGERKVGQETPSPYVSEGEFELLKAYTDEETGLPLLVDAKEVS